jgi:hypothetical protein
MGKINWSRVLLGGLLAGVIINVFEFVANGVFLAADWEAMMKALGRSTAPSPTAGVIFLLWGFLCGIGGPFCQHRIGKSRSVGRTGPVQTPRFC